MPLLQPHGVLVRTHYSLISAGTEGGTVRLAKKNLLEKARARPDLVRKVLNLARTDGVMTAYDAVVSNLDAPLPLGYSLAGEVVEVGDRVIDLRVGDQVACYGSMVANHAEANFIPRNMCAPLPDGVSPRHASFCMLGAIALNGVRRADVQLGCSVLVIGLGLIGQITVQLLRAAGCRVIGIDLEESKLTMASAGGAERCLLRSDVNVDEAVLAFGDGRGVDATIITAAAPSPDPVELAGRVTRQRGKVVALGRVPYELPRDEYLFKEIEFLTTLAFGPGVSDPDYEVRGNDYPAAHVRWTGNRNVGTVLQLIADQRLQLDPLVTHEYTLAQADDAFKLLTGENREPSVAILLQYDVESPCVRQALPLSGSSGARGPDRPGVSVIGAGSHAVSFLFDAIAAQEVSFRGIVSAGGFKAKWYGDKYGFAYAAADVQELFDDDDTDAVFILSRHDSHGELTARALAAGKHVFVEKPLCLTNEQLDAISAAHAAGDRQLMVGYNRRFAALGLALREQVAGRAQPLTVSYRMNAGVRPPNHWLHDLDVGGGLILGEGVHFIDFIQYLVGHAAVQVSAHAVPSQTDGVVSADNVFATISYADGSVGAVHYLSNGDKSFGRERIEVSGDNAIAVLEDWRSLVTSKEGRRDKTNHAVKQDKGFDSEVAAFVGCVRDGCDPPIAYADIENGIRTAFAILESLRTGETVRISPPDSTEQ
jgi:predicted dehydrogenase/threonine dehydrogenase-like Zn-dependent dehydrogenase